MMRSNVRAETIRIGDIMYERAEGYLVVSEISRDERYRMHVTLYSCKKRKIAGVLQTGVDSRHEVWREVKLI